METNENIFYPIMFVFSFLAIMSAILSWFVCVVNKVLYFLNIEPDYRKAKPEKSAPTNKTLWFFFLCYSLCFLRELFLTNSHASALLFGLAVGLFGAMINKITPAEKIIDFLWDALITMQSYPISIFVKFFILNKVGRIALFFFFAPTVSILFFKLLDMMEIDVLSKNGILLSILMIELGTMLWHKLSK